MSNKDRLDDTYWVLEYLKEEFREDGMNDEVDVLNEAHNIIQKYDHELDFEPGQTEDNHE